MTREELEHQINLMAKYVVEECVDCTHPADVDLCMKDRVTAFMFNEHGSDEDKARSVAEMLTKYEQRILFDKISSIGGKFSQISSLKDFYLLLTYVFVRHSLHCAVARIRTGQMCP